MTTELILYFAFAFFINVFAVARLTRLVVDDDFPPVMDLRARWYKLWTDKDGNLSGRRAMWAEGLDCAFCVSFWIALVNGLFAWLSFNGDGKLDWWWWVPNLIFAGAYLAAMINKRDLPPA